MEMHPIELLGLGTCLMSQSLDPLIQSGLVRPTLRGTDLRPTAAYCLDDAIQFARFLRGELDIPEPIRPLCDFFLDWKCSAIWDQCRQTCELILVEVFSPIQLRLGPYSLIRGTVISHVTDPLLSRRDDMRRVLNSWWNQGLWAGKENIREETGRVLADAVDASIPNHEVVRKVFRDARPFRRTRRELTEGLALLRELLGVDIAVLTAIHRYLPDGRMIEWPPKFIEETLAAARELEMPVFQPTEIVERHGVERAWKGEGGPYREEFWPVVGAALFEFIGHALNRRIALIPASQTA